MRPAHAYLAHHYGDDCGAECRAAGHVVLLQETGLAITTGQFV